MSKPNFTWYEGMKVTPHFSSQEEIDKAYLPLTMGKHYTVLGDDGDERVPCIFIVPDDGKKFGFYWFRFRPASLDDLVEL